MEQIQKKNLTYHLKIINNKRGNFMNNETVEGTIIKKYKIWWIKINTKIFRTSR